MLQRNGHTESDEMWYETDNDWLQSEKITESPCEKARNKQEDSWLIRK